MRPETYAMVSEREEHYWWHRARRAMAAGLLGRHGLAPGCRAVDLGCGTGGNLSLFAPFSPRSVVGLDLSPIALEHARRKHPSAPLVRADLTRALPFADASMDVVTIFNVLYHQWIDDEVEVLSEACRILRPGGLLLATEPAFEALARQMDRAAMARRRYEAPEFAGLCRQAGLEIAFLSYFTSFGTPPAYFLKATKADMKPLNPLINEILYLAARAEAFAIVRGFAIPFGVTMVCVARKPSA